MSDLNGAFFCSEFETDDTQPSIQQHPIAEIDTTDDLCNGLEIAKPHFQEEMWTNLHEPLVNWWTQKKHGHKLNNLDWEGHIISNKTWSTYIVQYT